MRAWFGALLQDPDGSPSSTRVMASLCVVVGCGIAIAGMIWSREQAATVVALVGGGAGTFAFRTRSTEAKP